jgi:4-hydroxy-tetrahydrodipicolinate synthase
MNSAIGGVYLPIVTPFRHGAVDLDSYRRLVDHYVAAGVDGLIPLGTTGEGPTVEEREAHEIIEATLELAGELPVYLGIGANATAKGVRRLESFDRYPLAGYLVTAPYYNLPSQEGIIAHYRALAAATDKRILLYNIPYRTGRNLTNETILTLAELPNIVGVKDSCAVLTQSIELLRERPPGFSVFTGEDLFFLFNLVSGGDGGILASAHIQTERFLRVRDAVASGDLPAARRDWDALTPLIPLLFAEPNPAPIKHVLARQDLIASAEVRLPLSPISAGLMNALDELVVNGFA